MVEDLPKMVRELVLHPQFPVLLVVMEDLVAAVVVQGDGNGASGGANGDASGCGSVSLACAEELVLAVGLILVSVLVRELVSVWGLAREQLEPVQALVVALVMVQGIRLGKELWGPTPMGKPLAKMVAVQLDLMILGLVHFLEVLVAGH